MTLRADPETERAWTRWVMQTARTWDDISDAVKRTDIDIIDDDHQKLTELTLGINNLLEASKDGHFDLDAIQKQRQILESLYAYAEHHFHREEDLIKRLGLPDLERQSKQHETFLTMLRSALDDFNQGKLTVSIHLKQWILEWWVRHINEIDYRTFRQENMVERLLANPDAWPNLVAMIKPTVVERIDAEHKNLVRVAIDWVSALRAGEDGKPLLHEIVRCAREHFSDEEAVIAQHGLPGLEHQKEQHENFMATLLGLEAEKDSAPIDGMGLILNWWISHINATDSASFAFEHIEEAILEEAADWEHIKEFIWPTGIARLDGQHRAIAEKMLQIEAAEDKEAMLAKVDDMIELARHHFSDEEGLMARENSALLRVHADSHFSFLSTVQSYRDDLCHDRLEASRGLKRHLLAWWLRHIREFDIPAYGIRQGEAGT